MEENNQNVVKLQHRIGTQASCSSVSSYFRSSVSSSFLFCVLLHLLSWGTKWGKIQIIGFSSTAGRSWQRSILLTIWRSWSRHLSGQYFSDTSSLQGSILQHSLSPFATSFTPRWSHSRWGPRGREMKWWFIVQIVVILKRRSTRILMKTYFSGLVWAWCMQCSWWRWSGSRRTNHVGRSDARVSRQGRILAPTRFEYCDKLWNFRCTGTSFVTMFVIHQTGPQRNSTTLHLHKIHDFVSCDF